jgi:hypothetical protein
VQSQPIFHFSINRTFFPAHANQKAQVNHHAQLQIIIASYIFILLKFIENTILHKP